MKTKFPRVLVLSPCVFNYLNGGGVTFSNLFKGWPISALANLHSSEQTPDHSVCENFFRLTNKEIQRPWPLKLRNQPTLGSSPTNDITGENSIPQKLKKIITGNSGVPQHFCLTQELRAWLEQFKPDIIYSILGPIPHLEAILQIRELFQTKLVIHCMDDWHGIAYTSGIFRFQRGKMLTLLNEIITEAELHLSIGSAMSLAMSERYKKNFIPFQNTINVENFIEQMTLNIRSKKTDGCEPKILYYGSVFPFAQLSTIQLVARAVEKTNWHFLIKTSAQCFAATKDAVQSFPKTKVEFMLPDENDFSVSIANANMLLLPANFDQDSVNFLKFSMPTKIPGYMASGVPVLYVGPKEIAQGEYASAGWSLVVNEPDENAIVQAISRDVRQSDKIEKILSTAKKLVVKNHDELQVRGAFQALLKNLC